MYYFQVCGLNFKRDFSLPIIVKTFLSDILIFGWLIFYIQGWTYSLTSHADIMSCSSGVVIFIITVATWGVVHKYEVFAYILYFVGIFFLLTDPYALKEGKAEISYLGVILAINGAICLALFSYTIKYTKSQLHPIVQTEILFLTMLVWVLILFPFLSKSERFFSFDPEYGVFGWLTNWTYFFEVVCITAFVSGLLGNIGYFFSFKYAI